MRLIDYILGMSRGVGHLSEYSFALVIRYLLTNFSIVYYYNTTIILIRLEENPKSCLDVPQRNQR